MAERRMFAKTIIDSDAFLDMPLSTQSLYFHLSMRADDDGFINNPKKIQRMIGCADDDLKLLIAKNFIIPFESGIVVIKHWKIHNYIRNDRYKETVYKEEMSMLDVKENKAYTLGIPSGYQMDTQVRLGKDRIGKDSLEEDIPDSAEPESFSVLPPKILCEGYVYLTEEELSDLAKYPNYKQYIKKLAERIKRTGEISGSHYAFIKKSIKETKHKYGEYKNVLLTDEELEKLKAEYPDIKDRIERLSSYVASTGKSYKSHYATIRNWARKDAEKPGRKEMVPSWMNKKNQFNNFEERPAENMDDLEAALLGAPKTAANDEEIRRRAEALKEQFGGV